MIRLILALLFVILPLNSNATKLEDLKAHAPTSDTWNEQWFYNIADPSLGYFKVSLQTYISPTSPDQKEQGYIHLAFTPINGETVKYDVFSNDIILKNPNGSDGFYYEIPGLVIADKHHLNVTHPEFTFAMQWTGEHAHYWDGINPGQSPFGLIGSIPKLGGYWFLYTVGTPITYSFRNDEQAWSGMGYAQLDKGWYDKMHSTANVYTMGLSDEAYFMFTGAIIGKTNFELWVGKYISKSYNLSFLPAIAGFSMKREFSACDGSLHMEMVKLGKKIVVEAKADPSSFYIVGFPTVEIYGAEYPYMKSMQASVDINLYHWGKLKETIHVPQALLEFSDGFFCQQMLEGN